jgi:hypothetical protein
MNADARGSSRNISLAETPRPQEASSSCRSRAKPALDQIGGGNPSGHESQVTTDDFSTAEAQRTRRQGRYAEVDDSGRTSSTRRSRGRQESGIPSRKRSLSPASKFLRRINMVSATRI